jgi:hypothetical protein
MSVAHALLNEPGVIQAKRLIDDLKIKGFDVFYSPSSVMIMGQRNTDAQPPRGAMDELFPLHHEIGLLFALQSISTHYKSMGMVNNAILEYQQGAAPGSQIR